MKVLSDDLSHGGEIPPKFTCDGQNTIPELHWEAFPSETKSFAISVRDPDAPSGDFVHWMVCNIPATESRIPPLPQKAKQVINDFGQEGYGGPCPPSGTHRYFFRVYALDVEIIECGSKQEFFQEIEEHKIAEGELMATYNRQ